MKETLHHLRIHNLILEKMVEKYTYLELNDKQRLEIQKKVIIDPKNFNLDAGKLYILQLESLYIYSYLKSYIYSKKDNPEIEKLLLEYKIPSNSKAFNLENKYLLSK